MTDRNHAGHGAAVEGDAELITAARGGDSGAFGVLYTRHVEAARRLARTLVRNPADVDDLVAEAFAKILSTLHGGGGPDLAFRAYLLTSLRNTFYDRMRRERRLEITADFSSHDAGVPFVDTAVEGLERSLAARAFARLPERWQMVLWHLEVEGETPAEVAPLLGLTPNGVSALAYRARERLRQAYLQEHIADHAGVDCDWTAERLGAHVRGGLSRRETTRVQDHLDTCDRCRLLYVELGEVNSGLRGLLAPLVLGSATAGYLLKPGAAAAAAGAGAAGAGAGAGAGAAAGAAGEAVAAGAGAAGAGAAGAGAGAAGAAAGAAHGAVGPALAVLNGGRAAAGWARRIVTQNGPTSVATGSAVAAAIVAIAVGTAIFAGTKPPPQPARPNAAIPTLPAQPPAPGSPSSTAPTPSPSPSAVATTTPAPAVAPAPSAPPGGSPAPGPVATTGPATGPVPVPRPVPQPVPAPAPARLPLLVLHVAATPVGRLVDGGLGAMEVTVTVGAPALGVPEQTIGLRPGALLAGLPLRLDTLFPPGVRMAADRAPDGWDCSGTTCRLVSLVVTDGSTARVPLQIDRGARGDLVFTVSAPGIASATVTLPDAISPAPSGSWSGRLHGNARTIGSTLPQRYARGGGAAVLPSGGRVRWAGLYWSTSAASTGKAAPALLRGPGEKGATLVRPTDVSAVPTSPGEYRAFADVTDRVRAAGAGSWRVTGTEADPARGAQPVWRLVVVTEDTAAPLRQIVVRDVSGPVPSSPYPARHVVPAPTVAPGTPWGLGLWRAVLDDVAVPPLQRPGVLPLGTVATVTDVG